MSRTLIFIATFIYENSIKQAAISCVTLSRHFHGMNISKDFHRIKWHDNGIFMTLSRQCDPVNFIGGEILCDAHRSISYVHTGISYVILEHFLSAYGKLSY